MPSIFVVAPSRSLLSLEGLKIRGSRDSGPGRRSSRGVGHKVYGMELARYGIKGDGRQFDAIKAESAESLSKGTSLTRGQLHAS